MTELALVGAAHIHTPGFVKKLAQRDDVSVRCVWDHDADRAAKNVDQLPGSTAVELDSIWADDQIDAVVICSETDRHEDLVLAAAEAGKHLFVEKPLGADPAGANRMAEAIEANGLIFQTGYFMRGNPVNQFIKQQIEAGAFGKLTRVRHVNCHHGSIGRWFDTDWRWMADPKIAGVGAFGDLGTHSLDILLWWLGEVDAVAAEVHTVLGNYGDCDEHGEGLIRFHRDGLVGSLSAGWVSVANPVSIEIGGTEGHAWVVGDDLYFQSEHVDGADAKQPWADLPDPWPHAFDLFLDKLGGKDVPLVSASEAAYRSIVMAALYEAAQNHHWVKLD